ncbi:MBL fold metallo-hydrolase [Luteolibacter pohnpeiensis]|uniref:MBL fold metallo-hydrolase n=1 Tax=Luteolibacter pohnpeiensis TaxID=454153 RepID=A0A934VRH7_9BACT|nr:MBL fold metallo-hydrolase [Luteolibacter pohnpeiensis]MBK1883221.1 MBL fold metallo-hydrolase [Luteolibacter pohnpeiensis]
MALDFSLTFLGTGTSVGVPVIGCDCNVCRSTDPKNKRTRSSVILQAGDQSILVDSGPDLREQALREDLRVVDAVLYTHAHMDHVVGFDELRAFCWARTEPLPLYATEECMSTLKTMFSWAFSPQNVFKGYIKPGERLIEGDFTIGALKVTPLPVEHASVKTIGFLFDYPGARRMAYLPDVKRIPEATLELIREVDVLILDALRPEVHPTHFSLGEALLTAEEVGARETWLTHLGHDNDHAALEKSLPKGVHVAWDGLRLPGIC